MSFKIHPDIQMGTVHLTVADLARSLAYYQDGIGLGLNWQENGRAALGAGGRDLLVLNEQPGARPSRGHTGLYHFALLVPSRRELARTLQHLVEAGVRISGASDHAVSEALYLTDPDGHGIEIYRDRARREWRYVNGSLSMDTRPLDVQGVMGELSGGVPPWEQIHPQTRIGHMHLHISRLDEAIHFYNQVIGFDFVAGYGDSAGFVSAGGYHHHLGLNTWAGVGAPPPPDKARLLWYEIHLPDEASLAELAKHIQAQNIPLEAHEDGYCLHDPAGNGLVLRHRAAGSG